VKRFLTWCWRTLMLGEVLLLKNMVVHLPMRALKASLLFSLAGYLCSQGISTGDRWSLDQGLDAIRTAVKVTPNQSRRRRNRVDYLAIMLTGAYGITDDPELLDEAFAASQEALDLTPANHAERAECVSVFGIILLLRSIHHSDWEFLNQAVTALREALERTPRSDPDRSDRLTLFIQGVTLRLTFLRDDEGVEEAIRLSRDEVTTSTSSEESLSNDSTILFYVTELLSIQYRKTGDLSNLDEAIATQRRAIEIQPEAADFDFAPLLGWTLASRYRHSGDSGALDEAISLYRQALHRPPSEPEMQALCWSGLGWALQLRFERQGDPKVIEEAVSAHRQAVMLSPVSDFNHGIYWTNLGDALFARYAKNHSYETLADVIEAYRTALATTPVSHQERSDLLANLGRSLREQSPISGRKTLDESIAVFEEALETSANERPNRSEYALGLASALLSRYRDTGIVDDLNRAKDVLREAAQATTGMPWLRLACYQQLGIVSARAGQWDEATTAFSAAVELLPLIVPVHLRRTDREYTLAQWPGLACDAAACVLRRGPATVERALRLLEQGRGILVSHALQSGNALSWLRDRDPVLAERLEWLYRELSPESRDPAVPPPEPGNQAVQLLRAHSNDRPHLLGRELSAVLAQVREVGGRSRDVLAPSMEELLCAAADGPVVTINVSDYGSHALILTTNQVEIVPLPGLTSTFLKDHVTQFLDAQDVAGDSSRPPAQRKLAEKRVSATLEWLWDSVCGPVLDHLGIRRGLTATGGPRVWWLPTGLLNFLPLHAAGHHDQRTKPEPPTVIDRVVSSYAPTVRSLLHNRAKQTTAGIRSVLLVAVPDAPEHAHLPGVIPEVNKIKERFPDAIVLQGANASHDEILANLADSNWAHFACHARSDMVAPSASSLVAGDQPISVLEISNLHIPYGEFAFLSACGTTRGSMALADEAIHLTSAFQLAGYTHVVGTLWPVADDISAEVADHVYRIVSSAGVPTIAMALHEIVRSLRDTYSRAPSLWASHVHVGP
jgi:tetratricopeptide (TPR) repeat protein